MPYDYKNLNTEELKKAFIVESRQFVEGIDKGLPFDSLKEIRIKLRQIEAELHERGINP